MSWIYEKWTVDSEYSGPIECSRFLGRWQICAGGCFQTANYTINMWRKVLKRLSKIHVKQVLILGLGAGGNIKQLYKKFPKCQITAIELDPAMVNISQRTFLRQVKRQPRIITGDAVKAVENLQEKFDIILVDLFLGKKPAQILLADQFLSSLHGLLKPEGYLLLNAYEHPEIFDTFNKFFSQFSKIKYLYNSLAIYRHFGLGQYGDPLPNDYVQYKSSKDYWLRECQNSIKRFVGNDQICGVAWHHGPFYLESYQGDIEPVIKPAEHTRMIIWQPLTNLAKPKGWHKSRIMMNDRKTGYAPIGPADSYWKIWNSNVQRQRAKFLKNNEYDLFEGTAEEFIPAFFKVKNKNFFGLKTLYVHLLQSELKRHSKFVHCLLARNKESKKILAGLAVIDIPEIKQSHHLISFLYPEAEADGLGTGMIDYWYQHSIAQGFKYQDFGLFWAPGDDRSWQGFSRFKGQFGTCFIRYQNPWVKWVRKNK
ncbi:MAG: methyltransferase domain-containing protein [Candidatus Parcubacteria bacterium]|nr:methyltransferase domain-containing protein [Candidatus Parcubacteria bacterium]